MSRSVTPFDVSQVASNVPSFGDDGCTVKGGLRMLAQNLLQERVSRVRTTVVVGSSKKREA